MLETFESAVLDSNGSISDQLFLLLIACKRSKIVVSVLLINLQDIYNKSKINQRDPRECLSTKVYFIKLSKSLKDFNQQS